MQGKVYTHRTEQSGAQSGEDTHTCDNLIPWDEASEGGASGAYTMFSKAVHSWKGTAGGLLLASSPRSSVSSLYAESNPQE